MIEHEIDDHTGYGHKHPTGPYVSGKFFVAFKIFLKGTPNEQDDKRDVEGCKNDVGNENGKVDGAGPVVMGIRNGPHIDVIDDIRREENDGRQESTEHTFLMPFGVALLNLNVSQNQKKRAKAIEDGIEGGQTCYGHEISFFLSCQSVLNFLNFGNDYTNNCLFVSD